MDAAAHAAITQMIDQDFQAAMWAATMTPSFARPGSAPVARISSGVLRDPMGNAVGHTEVIHWEI